MLNIFKKNKTVNEKTQDLKQEEQRLLRELDEVRERIKSESTLIRNTEHIEKAFKDAGYEFSLGPHPTMWDMGYTLLTIKNIKDGNIITHGHHKPVELNRVLNYFETHLDTVIPLLKPREHFDDVDSIYIGQTGINISRDITYNSIRNLWYGTCKISITDNHATISVCLEHYISEDNIVQFPNGVVRGLYSDDGHAPIIEYKIKQDGVKLEDVYEMMEEMYKTLCETIEENDK